MNKIDKNIKFEYTDLILLDWCIFSQMSTLRGLIEANHDVETTILFKAKLIELEEIKIRLRPEPTSNQIPKVIDVWNYPIDNGTDEGGGDEKVHMASFGYYEGIRYTEDMGLQQSSDLEEVRKWKHFVVCCGDVMVRVKPESFPDMERIVHE